MAGSAALAAFDVEKQSQCSTRLGGHYAPDEGLLDFTLNCLILYWPV